tara:strand:+ start:4089 stop:4880 length:792 start_codon:yes stop_codon:yes gene_type:complete
MIIKQIWVDNYLRNFNYLVACSKTGNAIAIDPLDHKTCIELAKKNDWKIKYIFNTHEHSDHISGNTKVANKTGAKIIANKYLKNKISNIDHAVDAGDIIRVGSQVKFECLHTPGHTLNHMSLLSRNDQPALFAGDALFNAGAGNCKNGGDPNKLFETFENQFNLIDENTVIYPGHDYMISNLEFTLNIEPNNKSAASILKKIRNQDPSNPFLTTIKIEKEINVFFRLNNPSIISKIKEKFPELGEITDRRIIFIKLRELRDQW